MSQRIAPSSGNIRCRRPRAGFTREQAYVLCSVALDLRVSNVVEVPNVAGSALLPEDIFAGR